MSSLIVVILITVLVLVNSNSKAKRVQQERLKKERAQQAQVGQPVQPPVQPRAQQRARRRGPDAEQTVNFTEAVAALGIIPREAARRAAEIAGQAVEAPAKAAAGGAPQGASMLEDAECAGGSMAHTHEEGHSRLEDEECAGGSMAHTHSEGVSRATHARRMAAIDAFSQSDELLPRSGATALRRAVVMSEVLGKPKALRKT